MTDKALAQRLRECREYLGFTQQQVADHLCLHRPAVSEIEAGNRKVTVAELQKLARLYQHPVSYFLGEEIGTDDASELLADIPVGLEGDDLAEMVKFAQFLHWRKRAKKERQ